MKKLALFLMILVLCISLAACGVKGDDANEAEETKTEETKATEEPKAEHEHKATAEMDRDAKEHWYLCECGEKVDAQAHSLDDEDICTVCRSYVEKYAGGEYGVTEYVGYYYVITYNENENPIRSTWYDTEGKLVNDIFTEYALDKNGKEYAVKETFYDFEEDEMVVTEYDEYLSINSEVITDFDGNVRHKLNYEREYDDDGNMLWEKYYLDGELSYESIGFILVDFDGEAYSVPEKIIDYMEDGTYCVTLYDSNADVVSVITYDKNDKAIETVTFEYAYIGGEYAGSKQYINGKLKYEEEIIFDYQGYLEYYIETEYEDDGSKTVYKYDSNYDLLSERKYDKDGNQIFED